MSKDKPTREAQLVHVLSATVERSRDAVKRFATELNSDHPEGQLAWSHEAFIHAGTISVYSWVERMLTAEGSTVTFDAMKQHALAELLRRTAHPTLSTSPCRNLMDHEVSSAWARLLEVMDNIV